MSRSTSRPITPAPVLLFGKSTCNNCSTNDLQLAVNRQPCYRQENSYNSLHPQACATHITNKHRTSRRRGTKNIMATHHRIGPTTTLNTSKPIQRQAKSTTNIRHNKEQHTSPHKKTTSLTQHTSSYNAHKDSESIQSSNDNTTERTNTYNKNKSTERQE